MQSLDLPAAYVLSAPNLFEAKLFSAAISSAILAAYYNIPIVVWGSTFDSDLTDMSRFPTTYIVSTSSYKWVASKWRESCSLVRESESFV